MKLQMSETVVVYLRPLQITVIAVWLLALMSCFPTTTSSELSAVRTGDVVAVTATLKGTLVAGSSAILSWSPVEACKRSETTPEKGIKCASPVKVTITSPTKLSVQVVDGLKPLSGPIVR